MAQIKITITDNEDGTVRCITEPSARKIAEGLKAGGKATPASCIAIAAINAMLIESRKHRRNSPIVIPRVLG